MSTIQVDVDALGLLAARLTELGARLVADAGGDLAGRCGDLMVAAALQDVQDDWARKRQVVASYLDAAGSAVRAAASAYATVESGVRQGAAAGSGR
jgi:hypothetical protein